MRSQASLSQTPTRTRRVSFGVTNPLSIPRSLTLHTSPGRSPANLPNFSLGSPATLGNEGFASRSTLNRSNSARSVPSGRSVRSDSGRSVGSVGRSAADRDANYTMDMEVRNRQLRKLHDLMADRESLQTLVQEATQERDHHLQEAIQQRDHHLLLAEASNEVVEEIAEKQHRCDSSIRNLELELATLMTEMYAKYGLKFTRDLLDYAPQGQDGRMGSVKSMQEAQVRVALTDIEQFRNLGRKHLENAQKKLKGRKTDDGNGNQVHANTIAKTETYKDYIENLYTDPLALPIVQHYLGTKNQALKFQTAKNRQKEPFLRFRLALQLGIDWKKGGTVAPFDGLPAELREVWDQVMERARASREEILSDDDSQESQGEDSYGLEEEDEELGV